MKRFTKMLLALTLVLLGGMTANAQNRIELEDAMFKAWESWEPNSAEVTDPDQLSAAGFGFENSMYQEVGGGATIYGHSKVYYLWYANLTGTKTMYIEGTTGMVLRVLINRPAPEEGGDANGGATTEIKVTLDADGKGVVDLSGYEYVHLNAIKSAYGGPKGKVTKIEIEGTIESTGEQKTPLSDVKAGYEMDVVCISFGKLTNMNTLLDGRERLVFPTECVNVKVNDAPATLFSVEAMSDGRLFAFINEGMPETTEDKVEVSFANPTDPAFHIAYVDGRWAGVDMPSFEAMEVKYQEGLSQYYTYKAAIPTIVSANPESGSFNLPLDMKEFKVEFSGVVNCEKLKATLGAEELAVAPATGFAKEVTFTRSGELLSKGEYTLTITGIEPELDFLGTQGEEVLTLNFGPVDTSSNDQPKDILPLSYFTGCAKNGIPEGFTVFFGEEERVAGNTYSGGARMFEFPAGGEFVRGLYFRDKHVEYGYREGYELPLEEGKRYDVKFNTAAWKSSGMNILFEILNPADESVEYSKVVTTTLDVNGSTTTAVNGSTSFELKFIPVSTGNYKLKWTPCDASGNPSGWAEALLANVQVGYVPNVAGVAEMLLVNGAIANADSVLSNNTAERYAGAAYNELKALVEKYKATSFTSPSQCNKAAEELNAAAKLLSDHHELCDTYDPLPLTAQEMVATYAESKFATTEFYASLKTVAEKYEGKVLYEDNELEAAIAELDKAINNAKAMFTEGASKCNLTGYAVLLDRIRMGTATALTLGAEESEALIQQANEALSDDDAIADGLKARIKNLLYGQLKNSDNKLFEETLDEVTLETVKPKYDMTVFVKNPNIYKLKESRSDLSQENVPGWNIIGGELTTGWNQVGNDVIPADGMVSTWVATTTVWQTITDLPAGVYNVVMGFGERQSEEGVNEGSYMYVKTTEMADSLTSPIQYIGQSYPVDNHTMENIVVTDGKLTIGVQGGPSSHVFFNNVKLLMTAPAEGFDYNSAWSTAIDENVAPATTVERRYYDMTGRSVSASSRGVMIVKEVMNNGSVRTKKVIK